MTKPTRVAKIVGVVCPNKYGIHTGASDGDYVRYALLFDQNNGCTWIDNPLMFDLVSLAFSTNVEIQWVTAECEWCKSKNKAS